MMTLPRFACAAMCAAALVCSTSHALTPKGSPVRVNTHTTDDQAFPDVAIDGFGRCSIVWVSENQDGSDDGVYLQRYGQDGASLGPETLVNVTTALSQNEPSVAATSNGTIVVAWTCYLNDYWDSDVYMRLFDSTGSPLSGEIRVNTHTSSYQFEPSVSVSADGDIVVVWTSDGQDGSYDGVYCQRFNATGVAQGSEFRVNTTTSGYQNWPSVSVAPGGAFSVIWHGTQDGSGGSVVGRRFLADGTASTGEFRVNSHTAGDQVYPSIDFSPSGTSVICWASDGQDGASWGVFGQRYNSVGGVAGAEAPINQVTSSMQILHSKRSVAFGSDAFGVVWTCDQLDGDRWGVCTRFFDSNGSALTGDMVVNTYTNGLQYAPAIAAGPVDSFVIVWQSRDEDGSGLGVYAQWYGKEVVRPVFTACRNVEAGCLLAVSNLTASLNYALLTSTNLVGGSWSTQQVFTAIGCFTNLTLSVSDRMCFVRLAVTTNTPPQPRYLDNGDGTVTDTATGLMWSKNANHGSMTWSAALAYCDNLTANGYSDWRLPSVQQQDGPGGLIDNAELDTLGRPDGVPGSTPYEMPGQPFTDVQQWDTYWSSTTFAPGAEFAWSIPIYSGDRDTVALKSLELRVWPVRGGQ